MSMDTQSTGQVSLDTQSTGQVSLDTQSPGQMSLATQNTGKISMDTQNSERNNYSTGQMSLATQSTGQMSLDTLSTGQVSLATQSTGKMSLATQNTGKISMDAKNSERNNYSTGQMSLAKQSTGQVSLDTESTGKMSLDTQNTGIISMDTQNSARNNYSTGQMSLDSQSTGQMSLDTQSTGQVSLATQSTGQVSFDTESTGKMSLDTQNTGKISMDTQNSERKDYSTGQIIMATLSTGQIIMATQSTGQMIVDTQNNKKNDYSTAQMRSDTQSTGQMSEGMQYSQQIDVSSLSVSSEISSNEDKPDSQYRPSSYRGYMDSTDSTTLSLQRYKSSVQSMCIGSQEDSVGSSEGKNYTSVHYHNETSDVTSSSVDTSFDDVNETDIDCTLACCSSTDDGSYVNNFSDHGDDWFDLVRMRGEHFDENIRIEELFDTEKCDESDFAVLSRNKSFCENKAMQLECSPNNNNVSRDVSRQQGINWSTPEMDLKKLKNPSICMQLKVSSDVMTEDEVIHGMETLSDTLSVRCRNISADGDVAVMQTSKIVHIHGDVKQESLLMTQTLDLDSVTDRRVLMQADIYDVTTTSKHNENIFHKDITNVSKHSENIFPKDISNISKGKEEHLLSEKLTAESDDSGFGGGTEYTEDEGMTQDNALKHAVASCPGTDHQVPKISDLIQPHSKCNFEEIQVIRAAESSSCYKHQIADLKLGKKYIRKLYLDQKHMFSANSVLACRKQMPVIKYQKLVIKLPTEGHDQLYFSIKYNLLFKSAASKALICVDIIRRPMSSLLLVVEVFMKKNERLFWAKMMILYSSESHQFEQIAIELKPATRQLKQKKRELKPIVKQPITYLKEWEAMIRCKNFFYAFEDYTYLRNGKKLNKKWLIDWKGYDQKSYHDTQNSICGDDFFNFNRNAIADGNELTPTVCPVEAMQDCTTSTLDQYFQEMSRNPSMPINDQMQYEFVRLTPFSAFQPMSEGSSVWMTRLAASGHYQVPDCGPASCITRCFSCRQQVNWDTCRPSEPLHLPNCRRQQQNIGIPALDGNRRIEVPVTFDIGEVACSTLTDSTLISPPVIPVSASSSLSSDSSPSLPTSASETALSNVCQETTVSDDGCRVVSSKLEMSAWMYRKISESPNDMTASRLYQLKDETSFTLSNQSTATMTNYCHIASFLYGTCHYLQSSSQSKKLIEMLQKSDFNEYKVLHQIYLKHLKNEYYEGMKKWVIDVIKTKKTDLMGKEMTYVLKPLKMTLQSIVHSRCPCVEDMVILEPPKRKNGIYPGDSNVLQYCICQWMQGKTPCSEMSNCKLKIETRDEPDEDRQSDEHFTSSGREFLLSMPLLLPIPIKQLYIQNFIRKKEQLPPSLDVGGVRYLLAFVTVWKNVHFTSKLYTDGRWIVFDCNKDKYYCRDGLVADSQNAMASRDLGTQMGEYMSTVFYFRDIN